MACGRRTIGLSLCQVLGHVYPTDLVDERKVSEVPETNLIFDFSFPHV